MQTSKYQSDSLLMLALDAGLRALCEVPSETAMRESLYHDMNVTRYVSGVKVFFGGIRY